MAAPTDHLYTWTFTDKSLIIRFYRWLYQSSDSSITFCKLFWGVVVSPITTPLRLVIIVLKGIWAAMVASYDGLDWVITESAPAERMREGRREKKTVRTQAEIERRIAAMRQQARKDEEYRLALTICYLSYSGEFQGPKPKKPSAPTKVANAAASGADKVAAFAQRPKVDATLSLIGKFFVRCVFYPLMVLIPLTAVTFVAWLMATHTGGLKSGMHATFVTPADAIGGAATVSWQYIVGVVLGGILLVGFISGIFWLINKMDAVMEARPPKPPSRVGQMATKPFKVAGSGVRSGACATGRGFRSTGKFFVIGHHSVKYRTCPRIHISQDA